LPPEIEPPFRLEVHASREAEKTAFDKKKLKGARPW